MKPELTFTHRADLIDLASFDDPKAVEPCCVHLIDHGIDPEVYDESDVQSFVFFTKPRANVKLQVKEEDYAEAVEQLIEFEQQHPEMASSIYSCPECGSFAVEYPQFSRKFMTPLFLEWLSNLGLFKKQCYCRKCHAMWLPSARRGAINPRHLGAHTDMLVPPPA
ncbi:hypothetical protein [Prosthecobacter sp.]|uniref:hypothetical protein n=1 Tax=Prosthecobacter sp. TaxID=1965333 RepID=UPI003783E326